MYKVKFSILIFILLSQFAFSGNEKFQINYGIEDASLNVRTAPGLNGDIVATIEEGTFIVPIETKGSWIKIESKNYKEGLWVNTGKTSQYATKIKPTPKIFVEGATRTLFSEPGHDWQRCDSRKNCEKRGWPKVGTELNVTGTRLMPYYSIVSDKPAFQLWYQVEYKGEKLWISAEYVSSQKVIEEECHDCEVRRLEVSPSEEESISPIVELADKFIDPKCNRYNNYLEEALDDEPMSKLPLDTSYPKECIEESLNMLGKKMPTGHPGFRICRNGKKIQERTYYPPCASDKYLTSVHNSFTKVMKCMGLKPQELFPLFLIESNFAVSSKSDSGADGLGHFIDNTVKDVNKFFNQYKNEMSKVSPKCKKIASHIDKMVPPIVCDTVDVPKNPLASIFYTAALYKDNKKRIAERIYEYLPESVDIKALQNKLDKANKEENRLLVESNRTGAKRLKTIQNRELPRVRNEISSLKKRIKNTKLKYVSKFPELQKIMKELTLYAHNWGVGGVRSILKAMLKTNNVKGITYATVTGPKGLFLKTYRQKTKDSASRTQEKANYVYKTYGKNSRGGKTSIRSWVQHVNKKVGGRKTCGNY